MLHFLILATSIYLTHASDIILLQVLYRHGARTPIHFFPKHPEYNTHWWQGHGKLTVTGTQQQYRLGQYLRTRYSTFLHQQYRSDYVHVRSSDVDRTLMSAEANLAGLYPPVNASVWSKQLAWQPIPVHTVPASLDYLLVFEEACANFKRELDVVYHTPEMLRIDHRHRHVYAYLQTHTGLPVANMSGASRVYDTLFIIDSDPQLQLPAWALRTVQPFREPVYPHVLERLHNLYFQALSATQTLRRLGGGVLLSEVLQHMKHAQSRHRGRQLYMYSAHDTTVSALLGTLGVFNNRTPPFASCVMLELHSNRTVSIQYRNNSDSAPHPLAVPGCPPGACTLERLLKLTRHVLEPHPATACTSERVPAHTLYVVCALTAVLLLCALLSAAVCVQRYRSRRVLGYASIHECEQ